MIYCVVLTITKCEIKNHTNNYRAKIKCECLRVYTIFFWSYFNYYQEVRLGEEVETHITFVDHDKKRIHYKLSMFHKEKKYLAATNEVLSLYVDLSKRKVVEFDPDRLRVMDDFVQSNSSKFNSDKLVFSGKLKK